MKIAVHLHIYYLAQVTEILARLHNLNIAAVDYDLFVTMVEPNPDVIAKIRAFNPDAKIWQTENRGYDIGPFIDFLHQINLGDYDYVLKLHTKNQSRTNYTLLNGHRFDNALWGRVLYDALLATPARISENLNILERNPNIGMLGSKYCLTGETGVTHTDSEQLQAEALRIFGRKIPDFSFVAGSMFLARAQVLKPFLKYAITDFAVTDSNTREGTLAHIVERLFGAAVTAAGYKMHGIVWGKYLAARIICSLRRFCYQSKVTRKRRKITKIFRLTVHSTPLPEPMFKTFAPAPEKYRRLAVFAAYSPKNTIGKDVVYYLQGLKKVVDNIIVVADNPLTAEEAKKIDGLVTCIIAEKHGEYDFGSYKRGFFYAKEHGLLKNIDELVFCNDSCYAPVFPFAKMFEVMRERSCDFWGMTQNIEFSPHLQSYFLVFRPQTYNSLCLVDFMHNITHQQDVQDVIKNYEVGITNCLAKHGLSYDSYIPYPSANAYPRTISEKFYNLTAAPVWLLEQQAPIVKKKAFAKLEANFERPYIRTRIEVCRHNPAMGKLLPSTVKLLKLEFYPLFRRFLFQKKVTRSGKILIKICKLPIYIGEVSSEKS